MIGGVAWDLTGIASASHSLPSCGVLIALAAFGS